MKNIHIRHRRAFAALVPATLALAAPAFAQEAPPAQAPVQAPPVVTTATPPPVVSIAPPPATSAVPRPAPDGIGDPNSSTPVAPEALAQAEESRAVPAQAPRAAPRAAPRPPRAPVAATAAVAPVQSPPEPVAFPSPAPVQAAEASVEPAAPVETAPAAEDATTTSTTAPAAPVWPWIVGGLIVLGALLAFFLRRRPRVEDYDEVDEEPVVYVEPEPVQAAPEPVIVPVAPPVAPPVARQSQSSGAIGRLQPQFLGTAPIAAPLDDTDGTEGVAVEAELAEPEATEVAALTADSAHADRPWLEFALRPVRAGSTADEVSVEIELTVANSGGRAAQDVRISTMMFADGPASDIAADPLLADRAAGDVSPVTIEPGAGTRIDAMLTLSRAQVGADARMVNPVIVADARYTLADGSEGRTSASFTIGAISDDDDLRGIAIHRPQMSDDIEARLHGTPDHA